MTILGTLFDCEKKSAPKNRLGGSRQKSLGPQKQETPMIELDAIQAPQSTDDLLVWKWDAEKREYDYNGCDDSYKISSRIPKGSLDTFFEDLKKLDFYDHTALFKKTKCCSWLWIILCYVPCFCCGFIYFPAYFLGKYMTSLIIRQAEFQTACRNFNENILSKHDDKLEIWVSEAMGYIFLREKEVEELVPENQEHAKLEENDGLNNSKPAQPLNESQGMPDNQQNNQIELAEH